MNIILLHRSRNIITYTISKCPVFAFLLASLLLPNIAMADVFKCKVGGATVYQGLPCDGKAGAAPYVNKSSGSGGAFREGHAHSLTLKEIFTAMRTETALRRKINADRDREMNALSRDDSVGREQIVKKFMAKFEASDSRSTELSNEVRRRCPGGSSLGESSPRCLQ